MTAELKNERTIRRRVNYRDWLEQVFGKHKLYQCWIIKEHDVAWTNWLFQNSC